MPDPNNPPATTLPPVSNAPISLTDISAALRVGYGTRVADFDDQIAIIGAGGPFSGGGDSGSLIVDAVSLRPVGLLSAGGAATTSASPLDVVLARFGVQTL